jgi:dephospho-CoA kinase
VVRVLVTGMSGTGKSTVLQGLGRRGHRVVDTDDAGWSEEADTPDGGVEQLWIEERMAALLERPGPVVVGGCVRNQGLFRERFDAVVLLSAPVEVMLRRLATRTANPFGKAPAERERILRDLAEVEPLLRAASTIEIRTDRPLCDVVDDVEAVAAGTVGG